MKIRIVTAVFLFSLLICSGIYAQEELNITTYYPSPYGSYRELSSTGNTYLATDNTANVGVGISSPLAKLHLVAGAAGGVIIQSGASGWYSYLEMGRDANDASLGVAAAAGDFSNDSSAGDLVIASESNTKKILLNTGAGAAVLALNNGNVGVGTASPGEKLEVNGKIKVGTGGSAGKAVCWKNDGKTLGYCSTQPDAGGNCNCN